ncbi:hypothetical protein ES703_50335 [subsurface metagenome]
MGKTSVYAILAVGFTYTVTIFGGAFASGREIMQFFGSYGTWGLWGAIWALILFAYFGLIGLELGRRWKTYDYKSFVTKLYESFMPHKWASRSQYVFEIAYLFICILVLGIIIATGGSLVEDELGIPYLAATAIMAIIILLVVMYGAKIIRAFNFTITWVLLAAAVVVLAVAFAPIAGKSAAVIASGVGPSNPIGWLWGGGTVYTAYNLLGIIMLITVGEVILERKGAFWAGAIGGIGIGVLVLLEYIICMAYYPEILEETLPLYFVCLQAGIPAARYAYDVILIGAVVTTGVGVTFPVVRRFMALLTAKYGEEKKGPYTIGLLVLLLVIGYALSGFGLIPLVAKGFTWAGWTFTVVFLLPMLIFGSIMVWKRTDKVIGKAS